MYRRSRRAAGRVVAAGVPDRELTAPADTGDGPPVAVLDPVGGGEAESPSLARVMITSPTLARFPSANRTSDRRGLIEAMITGAAVEVGNQLRGWGQA